MPCTARTSSPGPTCRAAAGLPCTRPTSGPGPQQSSTGRSSPAEPPEMPHHPSPPKPGEYALLPAYTITPRFMSKWLTCTDLHEHVPYCDFAARLAILQMPGQDP